MKKKALVLPLLTLLLILVISTPAFAWYGSLKYATIQDVHLTDTYWWAREIGFNDNDAKIISKSDDGVDMGRRFYDKTWHLDRREDTGDAVDTRNKHANEEMAAAESYIRLVPGSGTRKAQYLREQADEHLGRGLHSIQDLYAHMDAGVGKKISWDKPGSHGMEGVMVDVKELDGSVVKEEVELLYDDVLWDYTPEEGWHRHKIKEESTRWQNTKKATKEYLYQFLLYGYGPAK